MNYYPYIIDKILKVNSPITGEINNIKISYDPNRNYSFNKTAGYIFHLIQKDNDFNSIVDAIIEKYDISNDKVESIRDDVLNVLYDFYQLGFLGWKNNISPFKQRFSMSEKELYIEFCWLDNINIVNSNLYPTFKNPIISNSTEFTDKFILQSMYLNKDFIIKLYKENQYIGYLNITTRDGNSSFIIKSLSCDFSKIDVSIFYRFCILISKYIYKKLPYRMYNPRYFNLFVDLLDFDYPYKHLKDIGFKYLGDKRYENCLESYSTYLYHIKM